MKNSKNSKTEIKQLIAPNKSLKKTIEGAEVSLEELESLCTTTFSKRPRGCPYFQSTSGSDDVLF